MKIIRSRPHEVEIRISKADLERIGDCSLEGALAKEELFPPKDVIILFEQTSPSFRQRNDGPEEIIITEYVPMCLCRSICTLIQRGYNVIKIDEYTVDP